jgi:cytidylate kinase
VADLKVFLTAPLEVRAERVARRDGVSFREALEEILKREYVQWERFKRLYGFDASDTSSFDMVFNTDLFAPEEIAEIIVRKARSLRPS